MGAAVVMVPKEAHARVLQVCLAAEASTIASLRQLAHQYAFAAASLTDPHVEHMCVTCSLSPPRFSLN
jgi:hypothetical protein